MSDKSKHTLYDRLEQAIGADSQAALTNSSILICGLDGTGVEIAKDLILSGPRSVVLFDPATVTSFDLGTNCFLTKEDIGKNRAEACCHRLSLLNDFVSVTATDQELNESFLKQFTVVVLNNFTFEESTKINAICRKNNVAFILCTVRGLFGSIFTDFGDDYVVPDPTGVPLPVIPVASFTSGKTTTLTFSVKTVAQLLSNPFTVGSEVILEGFVGADQLSAPVHAHVLSCSSTSTITVDLDSSSFPPVTSGYVQQVLPPTHFHFRPLSEEISSFPTFTNSYHQIWPCSSGTLFACFSALDRFQSTHDGKLPRSYSKEDAHVFVPMANAEFVRVARQTNNWFIQAHPPTSTRPEDIEWPFRMFDVRMAELFSFTARGQTVLVSAAVGGMATQQIMNVCIRKYTPITQWFFWDFSLAILPAPIALPSKRPPPQPAAPKEEAQPADEAEVDPYQTKHFTQKPRPLFPSLFITHPPTEQTAQPTGSRYDSQIAIFGSEIQERLSKLRVFVVGAGATGSETLKNLAMMGVGVGEGGGITVTDGDKIELSNLSRQFLFNNGDIGKFKSIVASESVKRINPDIHITPRTSLVMEATEATDFPDAFWDAQHVLIGCPDNVKARDYLGSKSLQHKLAYLDCGTDGLIATSTPTVPRFTSSAFTPEQMAAQQQKKNAEADNYAERVSHSCTLKHFPYLIDHTALFFRAVFQERFVDTAASIRAFVDKPKERLEHYHKLLSDSPAFVRVSELVTSGMTPSAAAEQTLKEFTSSSSYSEPLTRPPSGVVDSIRSLARSLSTDLPTTFTDSVAWACRLFTQQFHDEPMQLSGLPDSFWADLRRRPAPITLDLTNTTHASFIAAAAKIHADMYGIDCQAYILPPTPGEPDSLREMDIPKVVEIAKTVSLPPPPPPASASLSLLAGADDDLPDEMKDAVRSAAEDPSAILSTIKDALTDFLTLRSIADKLSTDAQFAAALNKVHPAAFEKDSILLQHMPFVVSGCNLRAENYSIPAGTPQQIKRIATSLIPALSTSTAIASACMVSDLPKLFRPVFLPRSIVVWNINLANMRVSNKQPRKPRRIADTPYTEWDPLTLRSPVKGADGTTHEVTVQDAINFVEKETGLHVSTLICYTCQLYGKYSFTPQMLEKYLPSGIRELVAESQEVSDYHTIRQLELSANCYGNDEDDEYELPDIIVRYPPPPTST